MAICVAKHGAPLINVFPVREDILSKIDFVSSLLHGPAAQAGAMAWA